MNATLSMLRSECETCGAWSPFTGKTQVIAGRTFAVVRCPNDNVEFPVWNARAEAMLAAYAAARDAAKDRDAFERACATLISTDGAAIATLVASQAELPLYSIEDVGLPAALAARWCELLLDSARWRPEPSRHVRIEEALATALKYDSAECAAIIIARVSAADARAATQDLERRFPAADPTVLLPIVER